MYNEKAASLNAADILRSWRNWQTRTVQVRVRRLMGVQVPLTAPYQDRLAAAACPGFRDVAQFGRALRSGRKGRRFKSCHPDQFDTVTRFRVIVLIFMHRNNCFLTPKF